MTILLNKLGGGHSRLHLWSGTHAPKSGREEVSALV